MTRIDLTPPEIYFLHEILEAASAQYTLNAEANRDRPNVAAVCEQQAEMCVRLMRQLEESGGYEHPGK